MPTITKEMTDNAVVSALSDALKQRRIDRGLSQKSLAAEAGVGINTLYRLEKGAKGVQLENFVRVLRALDLIAGLNDLVPNSTMGPIHELKHGTTPRQRVSPSKSHGENTPFKWGDEGDD